MRFILLQGDLRKTLSAQSDAHELDMTKAFPPVRKPDRRRRGGRGGAAAAAEAGKMIMDELVDVKGELN